MVIGQALEDGTDFWMERRRQDQVAYGRPLEKNMQFSPQVLIMYLPYTQCLSGSVENANKCKNGPIFRESMNSPKN